MVKLEYHLSVLSIPVLEDWINCFKTHFDLPRSRETLNPKVTKLDESNGYDRIQLGTWLDAHIAAW